MLSNLKNYVLSVPYVLRDRFSIPQDIDISGLEKWLQPGMTLVQLPPSTITNLTRKLRLRNRRRVLRRAMTNTRERQP